MTIITKDELEEIIQELRTYRGRQTELITVYIPAGHDVNAVQRQLEAEKSTAKNIKSTATRKNVTEALEKIVRHLKEFKKTPKNGMAIFAGNISSVEGQDDMNLWSIETPEPIGIRLYRCDKEFVLDPLEEMVAVDEIYGLLVMDRKEATVGKLVGKRIEVIQKMTSGIPSKVRAGGQCLSPDTLIMKDNGEIIEIKTSHNPLFVMSENFNSEVSEKTPLIAKWENKKKLFEVITCYPRFEIKASEDHSFFVRTEKGIEEKNLREINEGDYLIMPEKIDLELQDQFLEFKPVVKQSFNMKKINLPNKINPAFSRILGYYLGDGSYEIDRITFFDYKKEFLLFYQSLIKEIFGIDSDLRFRESKNYWQLRVYSRIISQLFLKIFSEKNKTLDEKIPSIILRSSNESLAGFIAGFFDAEGYISKGRVALGINNEVLARQLQFALLRLGIVASVSKYDNRRNPYSNNIRYTLAIDDLESLKRFRDKLGFSLIEKQRKVEDLIKSRSTRNKVRQLVVNGREIARILKNSGYSLRNFKCPLFFVNKRQLSKELFKKKILEKIKEQDVRKRLEFFYNSNLIAVKIMKKQEVGVENTIDIETKNHNFIANGLIVHNSSQRFHRITEGLTKEFYKRIAGEMKKAFFEEPKLKAILVGGPIPTKDEFLDNEYLQTQLQKKVLGRVDIGDTDESGLHELVEKAQELLAGQEIVAEKKLLEKFFNTLGKTPELAPYKIENVKKALERGAVDTLIMSKDTSKKDMKELKAMAIKIGSKIEIVSLETEEGEQFKNLSGIGAMLRFRIE